MHWKLVYPLQWPEFLIMRFARINFDAPSWKNFIICATSLFAASTPYCGRSQRGAFKNYYSSVHMKVHPNSDKVLVLIKSVP